MIALVRSPEAIIDKLEPIVVTDLDIRDAEIMAATTEMIRVSTIKIAAIKFPREV
jgi:hypothetical protein